jgi:hypothetical protein
VIGKDLMLYQMLAGVALNSHHPSNCHHKRKINALIIK